MLAYIISSLLFGLVAGFCTALKDGSDIGDVGVAIFIIAAIWPALLFVGVFLGLFGMLASVVLRLATLVRND